MANWASWVKMLYLSDHEVSNVMTKILMGLSALLFTTLAVAEPAQVPKLGEVQRSVQSGVDTVVAAPTQASPIQVQKLGEVQQSVKSSISEVVKNLNKLTEKPQRDFITLAMGGVSGLAAGGFLSGLSILRVEVLGFSLVPIVSGLSGIYFANEGYFDDVRSKMPDFSR
ncbi:conserved hypothetical protein [Gammaproteobacteria bacterium]